MGERLHRAPLGAPTGLHVGCGVLAAGLFGLDVWGAAAAAALAYPAVVAASVALHRERVVVGWAGTCALLVLGGGAAAHASAGAVDPLLRGLALGLTGLGAAGAVALVRARGREAQLRAERERLARDLATAKDDLDQFVYAASHDFQEPARKVASFCQLLEQTQAERLDAEGQEFLAYAVDGARRMGELVHDLLTLSRVTSLGESLRPTLLYGVCEEAIDALAPAGERCGAEVRCDELPQVQGDPRQLVQLFRHLLDNALKFRGEKPPHVQISSRPTDDGMHEVAVRDNGIGIPAAQRERVFHAFKRLHARGAYPGTGVGLAICQKIVRRHGGRIWVEAAEGGGSVFRLTLPAVRASAETQAKPDED